MIRKILLVLSERFRFSLGFTILSSPWNTAVAVPGKPFPLLVWLTSTWFWISAQPPTLQGSPLSHSQSLDLWDTPGITFFTLYSGSNLLTCLFYSRPYKTDDIKSACFVISVPSLSAYNNCRCSKLSWQIIILMSYLLIEISKEIQFSKFRGIRNHILVLLDLAEKLRHKYAKV